jgi:predicted NAD/FAD-dependent oxidoreductase
MRAAVIGAGIAGLAGAAALEARGAAVTLFDKGRRPGGRVATRRAGAWQFDHGAQYATARDPAFAGLLGRLAAAGAAALWPAAGEGCWVGTPGMSALAGAMAAELAGPALLGRHVAWLRRDAAGWHVRHLDAASTPPGTVTPEGGHEAGPFDAVLLALPAPQAAPLLAALRHPFAEALDRVVIAPCWALMIGAAETLAGPDCRRPQDGVLAWVAHDSARPGREGAAACWVAHATPAWSRAWLEQPGEAVTAALLAAFATAVLPARDGPPLAPTHASVHRWRYALTEVPLGAPCLWDAPAGLGVCGDWCLGARVEAAWLSGRALAAQVF